MDGRTRPSDAAVVTHPVPDQPRDLDAARGDAFGDDPHEPQRRRGRGEPRDFGAATDDDFADFVARTRQQTGRLAWLLTGDAGRASRLAERAYAHVRGEVVGPRGSGDVAAERALRTALVRAWAHEGGTVADLDGLAEQGWPEVGVSTDEIARMLEARRSRRGVLAGGAAVLGVGVLGLGAWQLARLAGRADPVAQTTPSAGVVESTTVSMRSGEVRLEHVADASGERLQVVRDGRVLTTLPWTSQWQVARVALDGGAYVVTLTDPVLWCHALMGAGAPEFLRVTRLGGRSVGLAWTLLNTLPVVIVAGMPDREVRSTDDMTAGVHFELADVWAYGYGPLTVVHGRRASCSNTDAHRGSNDGLPVFVARLDGYRVYALNGNEPPTLTGAPEGTSEVQGHDGTWWVLLLEGAGRPTLHHADWDAKPRTLVLD